MFGQTIHFIRTVKDIKQDEISKKANISQSTYSKFEQNKSDIRSTSFVNILSVLDIPLHEFYFIHNKYKYIEQETFILRFFQSPYNNAQTLKNMKAYCKQILQSVDRVIIRDISNLCSALLLILEEHNIEEAKKIVKPIWDRLCKQNELFLYDVYLMNAILYFFSLDEVLKIKPFLERSITKYKDFLNIQRIYINLQLNIGILCIENNKYEQGLTIIEKSIEPAKKEKAYVQVAIAYVRKGICLKGQLSAHEDGDSWIQKGLNILEILEDRETLALLTNEIDYFLKVSVK